MDNISESTIKSYTLAFDWFEKLGGGFDKKACKSFVIGLREAGMNPGGCNVKIRSINSFLSWCFQNGHSKETKIKQGDVPLIVKTLDGENVKEIV